MFSAKTLMAIHEGVEQLALSRAAGDGAVTISSFHKTLFERLYRSFNNPSLLKEVGLVYLDEFHMASIALKHFDLAHQLGPKDRDIERLQKAAALAMARKLTDQPGHSGLSEAIHTTPEVGTLLRKTVNLSDVLETRRHLDETTDELKRKQQNWLKSGSLTKKSQRLTADYNRVLSQAQKKIQQTDFAGAFGSLDEAQRLGAPKEELLAAYAKLGLAAFDNGRMEEALDAFLLTRDLSPEAVEGWFNCGLVYQKVRQFDDALACYQESVRLAPKNPKAWCNLSSAYFENGNYEEAEEAAREALKAKSDYARAWDNLAASLSALNRLNEAAEACQEAIHIQPALHGAWFKLGVIHFQQENMMVAQEAFNMTGDNPDYFPYVLYYLSMIDSRRGELDSALQKLNEARNADPTNDLEFPALRELATALARLGRYSTSADFYTQITDRRPDDFSAWLALGTVLHRAQINERAREAYIQATALQPDNAAAWHNLGLLASDMGNLEESRDCFQREVDLAPGDAKAWYDLGVSLQGLGQEEESTAAFERAEELVRSLARRSSDLSAALSIVRRLNLGERVLKME